MFYAQTDNVLIPDDQVSTTEGMFESLKGLSFDDAIAKIANSLVDFSFRLLIAILVLYIGKFIIKRIYKTIRRVMISRDIDVSLTTFILSLVKILLYFILIVTIVGILGIETSSFLALFASAGVAIGMALSGTLQNFAGGVLILLLKPYKVGDYIEAQGYAGKVKAIQIFHTIINTTDNKAIIIPNGSLSTSSINNYSLESYRRVDWSISLSYGTDLMAATKAIKAILLSDSRIVKKYLDDDLKLRMASRQQEAIDTIEATNPECVEEDGKKLTWWQRVKCRRLLRKKKEEVAQAKINVENSVNHQIDCSPFAELGELADSSINITVRAWTLSENYWDVFFEMNRRFYTELPEQGFSFPFPQMDVHLNQVTVSES